MRPGRGSLASVCIALFVSFLSIVWISSPAHAQCPAGSCVGAYHVVTFDTLTTGNTVEGLGTVDPDLNIQSKPWVGNGPSCTPGTAKVIEVGNSFPYASFGSGSTDNACLDGPRGFGDDQECVLNYDFTFAPNVSVSCFSIHLYDFGDYFPYAGSDHSVTLTAYDASNAEVNHVTLSVGGVTATGDACMPLGSPGNTILQVSGSHITKVSLTYSNSPDPNVGYDDVAFCEEPAQPGCTIATCGGDYHTVTFDSLTTGNSVEGLGAVDPDLNIQSLGWAAGGSPCLAGSAKVIEVNHSIPYASYSSGSIDNACLDGPRGFGDDQGCVSDYGFTFAPGVSVSCFSIHLYDYGDYFPFGGSVHQVFLRAYNASNTLVDQATLTVNGGETADGDACSSQPNAPGNTVLRVNGLHITRVALTYDAFPDPNVGYDDIAFCEEANACPDSEVVYYKFDDPNNRGKDSSSNHLDGALGAAIPVLGKCGTALRFLPDNDVMDFSTPSNSQLDITDAMSGTAWIRIRGTEATDYDPSCTEGTIFSKGGNYWFQVEQNNDRLVFQNEGSGNELAVGFYPFPINTWTQVGFVRGPWTTNGQSLQFYVNCDTIHTEVYEHGTPTGTNLLHNPASANGLPFMVGDYGFNANPAGCEFNGDLDEIKVFNRALSYDAMAAVCSCPCDTLAPCPPLDSLVINSGWDQVTNSLIAEGSPDNEWTVVDDPDPSTTEPRPAYVIPPYQPSWANPETDSRWISSYPTSNDDRNGTYKFQYHFCLQDTVGASIDLCLRADDEADVYLNGNLLGSTGTFTFASFRTCVAMVSSSSSQFVPFENTLEVDVHNTNAVAMGMDLVGSVHGHVPEYVSCCSDTTASLLGNVWQDNNVDATKQSGEPELSGWLVSLSGSKSKSVLTDALGNYYFSGLPAGTFTVTQVPNAGFASSEPAPAGPGTYTVILDKGEARDALNFGRYTNTGAAHLPSRFAITGIRPNPTSGQTAIEFALPARAAVEAKVYDVAGRMIADLAPGTMDGGDHRIMWDGHTRGGDKAHPGVYFIRIRAAGSSATTRLIFIR